jgi:hypothetical protein
VRIVVEAGGVAERYAASCRGGFWRKVFRLEADYIAERLRGCGTE